MARVECRDILFGRCLDDHDVNATLTVAITDLKKSASAILIVFAETLVLSYILFSMYRYCTKYSIYFLYVLAVLSMAAAATYFFVNFAHEHVSWEEDKIMQLVYGCILVVATLISLFCMIKNRRKITLVIQLFKEASNALAEMPLLAIQPIITFVVLLLSSCLFLCFLVIIESAGREKLDDGEVTFEKDFLMKSAFVINIAAFLWFCQFILGCQNFIIAGAVCRWFFNNQTNLKSPIKRSFSGLIRFHLGSLCLGSILITFVTIIQLILEPLTVSNFFARFEFKNKSFHLRIF